MIVFIDVVQLIHWEQYLVLLITSHSLVKISDCEFDKSNKLFRLFDLLKLFVMKIDIIEYI